MMGFFDGLQNMFYDPSATWTNPDTGMAMPVQEYNQLGGLLAGIGDVFAPQGGNNSLSQLQGGQQGQMSPQESYMNSEMPVGASPIMGADQRGMMENPAKGFVGLLGDMNEPEQPEGIDPKLLERANQRRQQGLSSMQQPMGAYSQYSPIQVPQRQNFASLLR